MIHHSYRHKFSRSSTGILCDEKNGDFNTNLLRPLAGKSPFRHVCHLFEKWTQFWIATADKNWCQGLTAEIIYKPYLGFP